MTRRPQAIGLRCSHCQYPAELIGVTVSIGVVGPVYRELCRACCALLAALLQVKQQQAVTG